MDPVLFATAVAAGIVYVLTPGPATLAVLGLGAAHGRRRALMFFLGHGVGDLTWSALALGALVGASRLGPELFRLLGFLCGAYLIWLGVRAIRGGAGGTVAPTIGAERPIRTGMLFGLTNPKAYPFSLAMYGALAVGSGPELGLADAGLLFAATTLGMAIGDGLTVAWTGLPAVGRFFLSHRGPITRAIGVLFVLFGIRSVVEAAAPAGR